MGNSFITSQGTVAKKSQTIFKKFDKSWVSNSNRPKICTEFRSKRGQNIIFSNVKYSAKCQSYLQIAYWSLCHEFAKL